MAAGTAAVATARPGAPPPTGTGDAAGGPATGTTPSPTGGTPDAPGSAPSGPPPEFWTWLADVDPQEAARHNRRLANHIGTVADRQANERLHALRPRIEAEVAESLNIQQQVAELRRLRDEDPEAFAQKDKELEALREQNEASLEREKEIVRATWGEVDAKLREFNKTLPYDVQVRLANQRFLVQGDEAASRMLYLSTAFQYAIEHARTSGVADALPAELAKRQREIEDGMAKAANAQAAQAHGRLDPGNPGVADGGDGPMTQDEYDAIRPNKALRRSPEVRARIIAGVQAGLITRDAV